MNNRVQAALARLPQEVQRNGVTVRKQSSAVLQFIFLYSEDGARDPLFLSSMGTFIVALHVALGTVGAKFNPFGSLLVSANVIVPMTRSGLRSRVGTVVGVDWAF